jgi:hypothetical protein
MHARRSCSSLSNETTHRTQRQLLRQAIIYIYAAFDGAARRESPSTSRPQSEQTVKSLISPEQTLRIDPTEGEIRDLVRLFYDEIVPSTGAPSIELKPGHHAMSTPP